MSIPYISIPNKTVRFAGQEVPSFLSDSDQNVDKKTIESFGEEWSKFSDFDRNEIDAIGSEYFDIVPPHVLNHGTKALDVGCGSGRWSLYLAQKVGFIEAIDPSKAVFVAQKALAKTLNARVTQGGVDLIPFPDDSFDLVFSLGVLHHIPNTFEAMQACVRKVKPGGYFLVYLYYSLDNRGLLYWVLFRLVDHIRRFVCGLPCPIKQVICDIIGLTVYWPISRLTKLLRFVGMPEALLKKIPLSYYSNKSIQILMNDSLDRFGTPLEQRFSKNQIQVMMEKAGLKNIVFSEKAPFWHAIGQKI